MTVLYRAVRWLAAGRRWRRLARAAWRDGADLYAALVRLTNEPERSIWPEPGTQTPCEFCGGRRCKGCEEPARITADEIGWLSRHGLDEVPPSLRERVALWAKAYDRAKLLSRHIATRWDHLNPTGGIA